MVIIEDVAQTADEEIGCSSGTVGENQATNSTKRGENELNEETDGDGGAEEVEGALTSAAKGDVEDGNSSTAEAAAKLPTLAEMNAGEDAVAGEPQLGGADSDFHFAELLKRRTAKNGGDGGSNADSKSRTTATENIEKPKPARKKRADKESDPIIEVLGQAAGLFNNYSENDGLDLLPKDKKGGPNKRSGSDKPKFKPERKCYYCDKVGAKLVCTRCKDGWYCSRECQRKDWKNHKFVCRVPVVKDEDFEEERREAHKMLADLGRDTEHNPVIRTDADILYEQVQQQVREMERQGGKAPKKKKMVSEEKEPILKMEDGGAAVDSEQTVRVKPSIGAGHSGAENKSQTKPTKGKMKRGFLNQSKKSKIKKPAPETKLTVGTLDSESPRKLKLWGDKTDARADPTESTSPSISKRSPKSATDPNSPNFIDPIFKGDVDLSKYSFSRRQMSPEQAEYADQLAKEQDGKEEKEEEKKDRDANTSSAPTYSNAKSEAAAFAEDLSGWGMGVGLGEEDSSVTSSAKKNVKSFKKASDSDDEALQKGLLPGIEFPSDEEWDADDEDGNVSGGESEADGDVDAGHENTKAANPRGNAEDAEVEKTESNGQKLKLWGKDEKKKAKTSKSRVNKSKTIKTKRQSNSSSDSDSTTPSDGAKDETVDDPANCGHASDSSWCPSPGGDLLPFSEPSSDDDFEAPKNLKDLMREAKMKAPGGS